MCAILITVKIGKEMRNGTLILKCNSWKRASEIEYEKKEIIDKINSFFWI